MPRNIAEAAVAIKDKMPRRTRKQESGVDPDAGGDAKKAKISDQVASLDARWEWEDDTKWKPYAKNISQEICEAFESSKKQVSFDVAADTTLIINFDRMTQKNKKTGWQRRIRCVFLEPSDGEYYCWQWQDDSNNWNPYGINESITLEKAKTAGKNSVSLTIKRVQYTIDLNTYEQTNDASDTIRDLERAKSDAGPAPAAIKLEPAPSTSTTSTKSSSSTKEAKKSGAATKSGRGKSGKVKQEPEVDDDEKHVKTIVIKGKAPVDPECVAKSGVAHVFCEGNDIWDAMLNQTNLMNNNNKYYLLQLLEDDNKKSYTVWFRWGRVGKKGQNSLHACGPNLENAKNMFRNKFHDKTKNSWETRKSFVKVPGKYDLLEMDYSAGDAEEEPSNGTEDKKTKIPESKLDKNLQELIKLICDIKTMENVVMEMKYDAKKAPLGKLTNDQIKAGYAALKKIDNCITNNDFGQKLVQACDEFYTRIPHDFGMTRPPVIRTKNDVKSKIELLDTLGDIQIAMKLLKEKTGVDENPVDHHYKSLKCDLKTLDKTNEEYKLVEQYLKNTHASTHGHYKMEVVDIFKCKKESEDEKFTDLGNRKLLWHGSRLTNWMGILNQGLRIAPPEAPVTGYMFGKGVYFADVCSKSANYCFASSKNNIGLLLLSEVALGTSNELLAADYNANKLPSGKHSVMGMGSIAPDPKMEHTMSDGTVIPMGKLKKTGVNNPNGYTLNYNEFIVYDTKQIKMKYLLKVKFNFN